jgi:arylsulfatase A-like enzyme
MDAHFPYEPATEYNAWAGERLVALHDDLDSPPVSEFIPGRPWWQLEALERLYDGTIRQLDAYVERVISYLKRENNHDDTLVVITSDHGEGFGEVSRLNNRTKMITHSWGVHEVLSHVPLVVKYPNQSESEIIENFASLVGFPEAVRKVFNGNDDHRSFITEDPVVTYTTRLREEDDAIFEESEENVDDYYGPWQAVYERSGDAFYKYIRQGERCATVNLGQGQKDSTGSDVENKIQQAFDSLPSANVKKVEQDGLSDDIEEKLTDLGYLR